MLKPKLPQNIEACLFDLDGVLTQTATVHAHAWKQMFDDFLRSRAEQSGEPFRPFDVLSDYGPYVDGKLREDGVRSFLASRDIVLPEGAGDDPATADTVHGLATRKNTLVLDLIREQGVDVYEGSIRFLEAVKEAGLRRAVVSASKNTSEVLKVTGIGHLFEVQVDGLVAAQEGLPGKPAPDTFLAAARKLGVAPANCAILEDALAGVEAGRSGNFGYVIGVDRHDQADALRRHGADIVVTDVGELLEAE